MSDQLAKRYAPPVDLSHYALISVGAAVATIILKAGAAYITSSVGLLSDAAESLVNLVAAIIAYIALKISIRPPDDNHHFGHSKAEYFSAAVEGVMIFLAATFIIISAITRLIHPVYPESLGIGLAISMVAAVLNGIVGLILLRAARKYGSSTLEADGKHLMTDVVTSLAVLIGVSLVAITKMAILDAVVALIAGINIIWTGYGLMKESVAGLMDIAMDDEDRAIIDEVIDSYRESGRIEFHAIRTRQAGNRQFMDIHVLVPGTWDVQRGHDFTEEVIDALVARLPQLRVSAHLEPIEDPKSYLDETDY